MDEFVIPSSRIKNENYSEIFEELVKIKFLFVDDCLDVETIAIIPILNNKFACFSCENPKNICENKIKYFDILDDNYIYELFQSPTNKIHIQASASILEKFKEISEYKVEFSKLIYRNFELPHNGVYILGFLTKQNQNDNFLCQILKLFQFEKIHYSSIIKFEKQPLKSFTSLKEYYETFLRKIAIFQNIEIRAFAKKNLNFPTYYLKEIPLNFVDDFCTHLPNIFMRKINDFNGKVDISGNSFLPDIHSISFKKNYFFDQNVIETSLNFEINNEKHSFDRILFFYITLENIQIVIALLNCSVFYQAINQINEELTIFTKHFFEKKNKKFKNKLEKIEKTHKNIMTKIFFTQIKSIKSIESNFLLFFDRIRNGLIKQVFRHFVSKIDFQKKLKKANEIIQKKTKDANRENQKKVISKFAKNSFFLKQKNVGIQSTKNIINFIRKKNILYFWNLLQNHDKNYLIDFRKNEIIELEKKIVSLIKNTCKVGLILKEAKIIIFISNSKFQIRNSKENRNLLSNELSQIDIADMIISNKNPNKNLKCFYYNKDFKNHSFYIEFLLLENMDKNSLKIKIEKIFSANEIFLENFFLRIKTKISLFSGLLQYFFFFNFCKILLGM